MSTELTPYLAAFIFPPLVVLTLQAVLMRVLKNQSSQLVTMISMVLGYPVFFALISVMSFTHTHGFGFYLYLFLIYSFSAYTYFHVFNMSETSRRVRMLNSISRKNLSRVSDLEAIYDDDEMIQVRLTRLVSLGQIREQDGLYYPTGKLFTNTAVVFYGLGSILNRPWKPMKEFRGRIKNAR